MDLENSSTQIPQQPMQPAPQGQQPPTHAPVAYAVPQPMQVLQGPGYRVYEAQHKVSWWGTVIRYSSYIIALLQALALVTYLG
jgi:hypothetical protein